MQPVFIVAGNASGISELAVILNANGLACLAAAFEFDNGYEYAFASFLRAANVSAAEMMMAPQQVLDDYLGHCAGLVRSQRFCLHITPENMAMFDGYSHPFGRRPELVAYLLGHRFEVVRLARRGVFEEALREQVPQTANGVEPSPFAVDAALCVRRARQLERLSPQMDGWFRNFERYQSLATEAVFENGTVSEQGALLLGTVFGVPIANHAPPLPLRYLDFAHLVVNAAKVADIVADTPYAAEAAALLAPGAAS